MWTLTLTMFSFIQLLLHLLYCCLFQFRFINCVCILFGFLAMPGHDAKALCMTLCPTHSLNWFWCAVQTCSKLFFYYQVIRHRKMIHKINEPKFEPEMHDSRSQTGKRPPPVNHTHQPSSPSSIGDIRQGLHTQPLPTNRPLPSFVPYGQQFAGQPINPFTNNPQTTHSKSHSNADNQPPSMMMMKEEPADYRPTGTLSRTASDSMPSRSVTSTVDCVVCTITCVSLAWLAQFNHSSI